jgi:hypothetical protein
MQGKKAPMTGARGLPRPYVPGKSMPYEMSKPGQGPGESPTPPGIARALRSLFRHMPLPRSRS